MSSAVMVSIEMPEASSAHPVRFPVPGRAPCGSSSSVVTRQALVASALLHFALVAAAIVVTLWPSTPVTQVAVQTFDVSLVPLSALDTVPPTGRPQQENKPLEEPKTIKQSKPLSLPSDAANAAPETKKPLTSEKKKIKTAPSADTSTQQPQQASAPSAASSIGATINGSNNNPTAEPARISYQDMVATMLARAKRYPERALRRQTTGDGTIRIKIDASGDVTDFEIVESTASPILDEELKDMVERASPFPPFPADLRRDNLALLVPVSFRLQQ